MTTSSHTPWWSGESIHEGHRLLLRGRKNLRHSTLAKEYPYLLRVEQALSEVRGSGLPDPQYNKTLEVFDLSLIREIESEERGLTALIETFAGKRTYYFYVREASFEKMRAVMEARHPGLALRWNVREDPGWSFLQKYAEDYDLPSFLDADPS